MRVCLCSRMRLASSGGGVGVTRKPSPESRSVRLLLAVPEQFGYHAHAFLSIGTIQNRAWFDVYATTILRPLARSHSLCRSRAIMLIVRR